MRKSDKKFKAAVSLLICLAMVFSNLPMNLSISSVKADTDAIYVSTGKYEIERGETETRDIYVTDRAALYVFGKVTGTIYMQTTDFCDLYTEEDGSMWTPENVFIDDFAEAESVVFSGKSRCSIRGKVHRIVTQSGCICDGGVSACAQVDEIYVNGSEEFHCEGNADIIYVSSGGIYLESGGYARSVFVTGGRFTNFGRVDYLQITEDGTALNWLKKGVDPEQNGYVKFAYLENFAGTDASYDAVPEIFDNFGTVDSAVSYGSYVIDFGTIHNLYTKGGRIDLDSGISEEGDNGLPYSADRLYSTGTYIYADHVNNTNRVRPVKDAVINGGTCNFVGGIFENIVFETLPDTLLIEEETKISNLTVLDTNESVHDKSIWLKDMSIRFFEHLSIAPAFEQNGQMQLLQMFGLATGEETEEELGLEGDDFDFYEERDKYYQSQFELLSAQNPYDLVDCTNKNPVAGYHMASGTGALNLRKAIASASGTILDGTGSVNSGAGSISGSIFGGANVCLDASAEAWFEFDITEPGQFSLDVSAGGTPAFAMLVTPDGTAMAGSMTGSDSVSVTSLTTGKGYVCVYGAETPATVRLSKDGLHYLRPSFSFAVIDDVSGKTNIVSAAAGEVSYRIYDATAGIDVRNLRESENGILLPGNVWGHSLVLTATSYNEERFLPVERSFTYNPGADIDLQITLYENGRFEGSIRDTDGVSIYIYDADGRFVQNASLDVDWFYTSHLATGNYTAVFIKDYGNYCFGSLDDFDKFGLANHEDYIVDSFAITPGEATRYYNVDVPEIQPREYKYIIPEKTNLRASADTCVPDTLVTLVLEYALTSEKFESADAIITLMNGTRLEGEEVVIDGSRTKEFEIENGVIKVPLKNLSEGKVAICIGGSEDAGRIGATAQINVSADGSSVSELAGAARTDVVLLSINAPESTGKDDVYVYGKAIPFSTVAIYDGNVEIGRTEAKAGGGYELTVPLDGGIEVYEHSLYAVIEDEERKITSSTVTVKRDSFSPVLERFVMHYAIHGQETVLSLTGDEFISKDFMYFYWPGTVFTFEIELSQAEAVTAVYMGSVSGGVVKELPAYFDSASGKWIASGEFSDDPSYLPENFYIGYETGNAINVVQSSSNASDDSTLSSFTDFIETEEYKAAFAKAPTCTNSVSFEDDYRLYDVTVLDNDELEMSCIVTTGLEFSVDPLYEDELLADGYVKVEDEDGLSFVKCVFDEETGDIRMHAIDINQDPELYDFFKEASQDDDELKLMEIDLGQYHDAGEEGLKRANIIQSNFGWASKVIDGGTTLNLFNNKLFKTGSKFAEGALKSSDILRNTKATYDKSQYYKNMAKEINQKTDYLRTMLEEAQRRMGNYDGESKCPLNLSKLDNLVDDFALDGATAANDAARLEWSRYFADRLFEVAFDKINDKATKIITSPASKVVGFPQLNNFLKKAIPVEKGSTSLRRGIIESATIGIGKACEWVSKRWSDTMDDFYGSLGAGDAAEHFSGRLDEIAEELQKNLDECYPTPTPTPTPTLTPTLSPTITTPPSLPPSPPGDPNKKRGNGGKIDSKGSKGVADPSGFVYAGVPENRLSGVTCTVYYKDEEGEAVLWNAADYNQINPQVTDHTGSYFWMVPRGEWKVVCEAEGYETYETEWLPVPPPQTDVNINLLSIYAPKVENFTVNTKYALIDFDMYVYTDSVEKASISLTDASGKVIDYTLTPVASEGSSEKPELAKQFMLVPSNNAISEGESYSISISGDILGYNGKTMEEAYSGTANALAATEAEATLLEGESSVSNGPGVVVIVLIVAAVAIIAGVVVYLLRRKKKA